MNGSLKDEKMGQNHTLPRHRRISFRSPFLRRSKISHKNSLSHTFTFVEDVQVPELLNINSATEEELMTLSGITRNIAKNIVEHRKAIGRFKKVEDLALVSGIGANKLELIRPEICVSKNLSSLRVPSVDSLKSTDSFRRPIKLINVNKASVFELQCVHGITQEIAAAIIHYRTKKGHFKQIDDLRKVKNVDIARLNTIRRYLTVNSDFDNDNEVTQNGFLHLDHHNKNGMVNGHGTIRSRRKTAFGPMKINGSNGLLPSSLKDIYELLSAYSSRPVLAEEFQYSHNNKPAIRVGTWNLHQLSIDKSQNLGVIEVICRTILENRWSILAVQEVEDIETLKIICEELNNPTLHRISDWKENSRNWNFCVLSTNLGFIYDISSGGQNLKLHSFEELYLDEIPAIFCEVNVNGMKFSLLNIQLEEGLSLDRINSLIRESISPSDSLLILGDFKDIVLEKSEPQLSLGGLKSILPINTNTGIPNTRNKYYDNILVTQAVQSKLTGNWGIVKQGLTHLAIPNGWSWGGTASPHCPLWIELYSIPVNGSIL